MKKLLVIAVSVIMLIGCTGVAFAATITPDTTDNQGTTTVTYDASTQAYLVTLPADFALTTGEQTKTVTAANVLLSPGNKLDVTMETAGWAESKFNVVYDNTSKIPYTIKVGENNQTSNSIDVLSVSAGSTGGTANLIFQTTDANIALATMAGNHTDTLTFTVTVGAAE